MLERLLKPNYTKFLVAPIVKSVLIPRKVTPNTVTFFGVLFGLIAGFTIAFHQPFLGIITLLLSGYADTLDVQLATLTKQQTDLGCIYDIVSDRIVEIAIIFGLYFYAPNTRHLYTMLMIASILVCITCFLVVSLFKDQNESAKEKSFLYSEGLIERAEAFIFFIAMITFPQYFKFLALVFSLLVILTAALHIYFFSAYKNVKY